MVDITIKFDARDAKKRLNRFRRRARKLDPVMKSVGRDIVGDTALNIINQKLYDGRPMVPSKAATMEGRRTLIKYGRLLNSFTYRYFAKTLSVFSTTRYYKFLHRGTRRIQPPRPVLGISKMRERNIVRKVIRYLRG